LARSSRRVFWAIYELSDKVNKAGNPYKDVIALEAIDKPATTTSADNSALLAELRAIRALLTAIAEAQGLALSICLPNPNLNPRATIAPSVLTLHGTATARRGGRQTGRSGRLTGLRQ
jgi:hypothetical protein